MIFFLPRVYRNMSASQVAIIIIILLLIGGSIAAGYYYIPWEEKVCSLEDKDAMIEDGVYQFNDKLVCKFVECSKGLTLGSNGKCLTEAEYNSESRVYPPRPFVGTVTDPLQPSIDHIVTGADYGNGKYTMRIKNVSGGDVQGNIAALFDQGVGASIGSTGFPVFRESTMTEITELYFYLPLSIYLDEVNITPGSIDTTYDDLSWKVFGIRMPDTEPHILLIDKPNTVFKDGIITNLLMREPGPEKFTAFKVTWVAPTTKHPKIQEISFKGHEGV
jgi:hypothetical protein